MTVNIRGQRRNGVTPLPKRWMTVVDGPFDLAQGRRQGVLLMSRLRRGCAGETLCVQESKHKVPRLRRRVRAPSLGMTPIGRDWPE